MQIASLFARIGLKTDEEKAKSFVRSMNNAKATLVAVGAAVGTASAAIIKVTSDALDAAAAFKQFEVETGSSAQELQRWQAVAEQTNSSAEAVSAAIRAITSNQEQIRLGQGNISGFQLLGIDPRQDPFQILEQLRERTDGLSQAMKRNVLAQLGVGAGLLQTLELSNEQFDDLAGRAFIISPTAIETLARTRGMMTQAARGVEFLKAQIAVGLAPQIEQLTEQFIALIHQNEEGIINGFRNALSMIRRFGRAIGNATRFLDNAIDGTIGWENAMKGLIAIVLALNAQLLFSPIGVFIGSILLLIAILDDIARYGQGKDSVFGRILAHFPNLESEVERIRDNLSGFRDVLRDIFTENEDVENAADEWGRWATNIEKVVDAIRDFYRTIFTQEGRQEALGRFQENQPGIAEEVGAVRRGIRDVGDFFRDRFSGWVAPAVEDARTLAPAQYRQNQSTTVNNDNRATVNVQIDGADDPRAVGREVEGRLQRLLNGTSAQRARTE